MMRREFILLAVFAFTTAAYGQIRFQSYVSGFTQPLDMTQDPSQPGVQYVVQKGGIIRVIQNGVLVSTPFVNLSSLVSTASEEGLLGLAFPADYSTSGFAYVYYTDTSGNIQIARYSRSSSNPLTLDPASGYKIISQAHPTYQNHDGGTLRFGPDGYLYAGLGDGGGGNDPTQNGQNPNTLLAKMIRIDPRTDDFPGDPNRNYHIPADNPFLDGIPISAMGEIWDFGLRNPWKWSFDDPALGGTGALIIADVGQDAWEEVDFEQPGTGAVNYGWRLREGANNTGLGGNQAFAPLTDPIYQYPHNGQGKAIVGGYVYRGASLGNYWKGRYFFADEVSGQKWSFKLGQSGAGSANDVIEHTSELASIGAVASIDVDTAGELYFVSFSGGAIYKLVSAAVAPTSFTILRGQSVSGGLNEVLESDDQRAIVNAGLTLQSNESPVIVQVSTTAPAQTVTALRFFLEAQTSTVGLTQIVELWDYTAGAWVLLDSRAGSSGVDSRLALTASSPNRFIQSGTRQMRAQVRYSATGPTSVWPWAARIDQMVWGFYP